MDRQSIRNCIRGNVVCRCVRAEGVAGRRNSKNSHKSDPPSSRVPCRIRAEYLAFANRERNKTSFLMRNKEKETSTCWMSTDWKAKKCEWRWERRRRREEKHPKWKHRTGTFTIIFFFILWSFFIWNRNYHFHVLFIQHKIRVVAAYLIRSLSVFSVCLAVRGPFTLIATASASNLRPLLSRWTDVESSNARAVSSQYARCCCCWLRRLDKKNRKRKSKEGKNKNPRRTASELNH